MKSLLLAGIAVSFISLAPSANTFGHPTSAIGWRQLADADVAHSKFSDAADAYRHAAAIYARIGDSGAAQILQGEAGRYETVVQMYVDVPARYADLRRQFTRRRLEPVYGAYIGAFVDREDGVRGAYQDENGQTHKDCGSFNEIVGKNHAVFFMYMRYGNRFPAAWTENLRMHGAAAQLVLSPDSLADVRDDRYLQGLADSAARSGIPIFLRFAGEMNGDWVPYHGDPHRYIEAFRLVAQVFHQTAPNVAMVWCVNDVPQEQIARYYPGADAVDWVGVNFYSVPYNNGSSDQPAAWRNPADSLRYVYDNYSAAHPIMIGEYAASHLSKVDMRPDADFAVDKIGQLYSALPRLYPRIKAVHWLSMDTLKYAMPERQLNNYSLLDNQQVAAQYRALISAPYFLSQVRTDESPMAYDEVDRLSNGEVLTGDATLSAWVKSYDQRPNVVYYINGRPMQSFTLPGAYQWTLDTRRLKNGKAEIKAVAFDSAHRVAGSQSLRVVIKN